jgi:hypothetical protein
MKKEVFNLVVMYLKWKLMNSQCNLKKKVRTLLLKIQHITLLRM